MATIYWLGTADAVAQITTVQITAFDAATTYSLSVGGTVIASVAGNTDAATTATDLATAWNNSTHPWATGITASASTDTVTLTADTAGVPFTVTSAVSGGTGTIGSPTTTTASAGPNDWSTAANWSGGAVPVAADDVIIADSTVNICWGLDQSSVTLASVTIEATYTGKIGLDRTAFATSADGDTQNTSKAEYREDYLKIGADAIDIGVHTGPGTPAGSQRLKISNTKAGASTTQVHRTASAASESGQPPVRLLAANSAADIIVRGGIVGIAVDEPGETATVGDLSISAGSLYVGDGCTLSTLTLDGGTCLLRAAATVATVNANSGTLTTDGDYGITTLTVNGATVYANNTPATGSAITTANLTSGTLDTTQTTTTRTIATLNLTGGSLVANPGDLSITTLNPPTNPYTLTAS